MKEFNRMNKEAWKNFSRTIRTNKDKGAYACGQLFDAHQWLAIYTGIKGSGVEVLPLYEHKDGYIIAVGYFTNLRIMRNSANNTCRMQKNGQAIKHKEEG